MKDWQCNDDVLRIVMHPVEERRRKDAIVALRREFDIGLEGESESAVVETVLNGGARIVRAQLPKMTLGYETPSARVGAGRGHLQTEYSLCRFDVAGENNMYGRKKSANVGRQFKRIKLLEER